MSDWFTVDKDGLAKVLGRRGKAFAVLELIQNAWDAPGTTRVEVTLQPAPQARALLAVEDNSPDGFSDLTHAYTLFKESPKKADPAKRGRFDVGEKLVLAICDWARRASPPRKGRCCLTEPAVTNSRRSEPPVPWFVAWCE